MAPNTTKGPHKTPHRTPRVSYVKFASALPTPRTIDSRVFIPDAHATRDLCAFVLALALIYGDLKGLAMAELFLGDIDLPGDGPTAERGEVAGMQLQGLRLMASLIHELLDLVSGSKALVESSEFIRVLKRAPRRSRETWKTIVSAARTDKSVPKDPVAKTLFFVRNKIGFHYDAKEILKGYELAFRSRREFGEPMYGPGANLQEARFYFSDAAAQAYFLKQDSDGDKTRKAFALDSPMISAVHQALFGLVTAFLTCRIEDLNPPEARK